MHIFPCQPQAAQPPSSSHSLSTHPPPLWRHTADSRRQQRRPAAGARPRACSLRRLRNWMSPLSSLGRSRCASWLSGMAEAMGMSTGVTPSWPAPLPPFAAPAAAAAAGAAEAAPDGAAPAPLSSGRALREAGRCACLTRCSLQAKPRKVPEADSTGHQTHGPGGPPARWLHPQHLPAPAPAPAHLFSVPPVLSAMFFTTVLMPVRRWPGPWGPAPLGAGTSVCGRASAQGLPCPLLAPVALHLQPQRAALQA